MSGQHYATTRRYEIDYSANSLAGFLGLEAEPPTSHHVCPVAPGLVDAVLLLHAVRVPLPHTEAVHTDALIVTRNSLRAIK